MLLGATLQGSSTYRNAIGNGFADAAADKGHDTTGRRGEQAIMNHVAVMQKSYVKLIFRLQKYALAILEADQNERKRKEFVPMGKNSSIKWLDLPTAPNSSNFTEGCKLDFMSMPRSLEDSLAPYRVFWQTTRWEYQGPPTTWLELYALYRLWGGYQG